MNKEELIKNIEECEAELVSIAEDYKKDVTIAKQQLKESYKKQIEDVKARKKKYEKIIKIIES